MPKNVVDKSTWNAYEQENDTTGDSVITNPVSACLTTAYVRALLLATMNEANEKVLASTLVVLQTDFRVADIPGRLETLEVL